MPKHTRKKQRLQRDVQPLGSARRLDDDAEKDDEERRLENLLFGTEFNVSGKGKESVFDENIILIEDEESGGNEQSGFGNALEHLQDEDVSWYAFCELLDIY